VQTLVAFSAANHRPGELHLPAVEADQLKVGGDEHPEGLAWSRPAAVGATGVPEQLDEPLGGDLGLDKLAVLANRVAAAEDLGDTGRGILILATSRQAGVAFPGELHDLIDADAELLLRDSRRGAISVVPRRDEFGWPVVDGVEEVDPDDEAVVSEELEAVVPEELEEDGSGADVPVVGSASEVALGSGCSRRTSDGRSCRPPDPAPSESVALSSAWPSLSGTGESASMKMRATSLRSGGSGAGRRARMAPIAPARAPRARIVAVTRFHQRRTERHAAGSGSGIPPPRSRQQPV